MNKINKISTEEDLEISHGNLDFKYGILDDNDNNKLSIDYGFQDLLSFSKVDLENVQSILLKAYVLCHDELDDGVLKSISIEDLEVKKRNVLGVRQALKNITKYIESYDSLLTEFKEI